MKKKKLLFVITQFYKGGAEVALLNLFRLLPEGSFDVDFLIFDQMILNNATSLIPEIPKWIHVCNASEKEGRLAVINKLIFKVWRKITKHQLYRLSAYQFVKNKKYDMAFSYGEWMSPEFVAKKVNAKKKYVWIHTDVDKAKYIDEKILFGYNSFYDKYIFVSYLSKDSAEKRFPFIKDKTYVIHNMCDESKIIEMSKKKISKEILRNKPILLTVANLRAEKNYIRQVDIMKVLKDRGIQLRWYNIGSTANSFIYQQVNTLIHKYNLESDFILLGVDDNPYKYMAIADAVMVLSDFESWSLVITEAKIIGTPVIATTTSGAREQLQDNHTGILTDFSVEDIADKVQNYLSNIKLQNQIRSNLQAFKPSQDILDEFYLLIGDIGK